MYAVKLQVGHVQTVSCTMRCVLVQEAAKRFTVDTILAAGGFPYEVNALNFKSCEMLEDFRFVMFEAGLCSVQSLRRPFFWTFKFLKSAKNFNLRHERYAVALKGLAIAASGTPDTDILNKV